MAEPTTKTRLDQWLWSARFYKTRPLASEAVKGGHVEVNGTRAKPARSVNVGDRLRVRKAPFEFILEVLALRRRRVSAQEARRLYQESNLSIENRERLKLTLRSQAQQIVYDRDKPAQRDRRRARERKRGA